MEHGTHFMLLLLLITSSKLVATDLILLSMSYNHLHHGPRVTEKCTELEKSRHIKSRPCRLLILRFRGTWINFSEGSFSYR